MNYKKILNLPITKSALSTIILIIPIFIDVFKGISTKILIAAIIIVAAINIYLVMSEVKKQGIKVEELLEALLKTICHGNGKNLDNYRANIMLYEKKMNGLQMKHYFNMMGARDRGITIKSESSCCMRSYSLGQPVWIDLKENSADGYTLDRSKSWESMKCILSVPIKDTNQRETLGVLNVDSNLDLYESELGSEGVYQMVNSFSYIISGIL